MGSWAQNFASSYINNSAPYVRIICYALISHVMAHRVSGHAEPEKPCDNWIKKILGRVYREKYATGCAITGMV